MRRMALWVWFVSVLRRCTRAREYVFCWVGCGLGGYSHPPTHHTPSKHNQPSPTPRMRARIALQRKVKWCSVRSTVLSRAALHFFPDSRQRSEERNSEQRLINIIDQERVPGGGTLCHHLKPYNYQKQFWLFITITRWPGAQLSQRP